MRREPIWRRYRRFWGPDVAADVDEEIEFHLETRAAELVAQGVAPGAARQRALAEFGDIARAKHECREIDEGRLRRRRRAERFDTLRQDVRFGVRLLARTPGFTLVAVLTLALGIGANTAIFGAVDRVLLRPLPYPGAERIVRLYSESPTEGSGPFSAPDFLDLRREARSFSHLAATLNQPLTLTGAGDPERLAGEVVSPDYFEVFGVAPLLGRTFAGHGAGGGERLVMLGGELWRRRFGADPGVVGRTLRLNGEPYLVVGVMPPGFTAFSGPDAWVLQRGVVPESPFGPGEGVEEQRGARYLMVAGRLREGVDPARARAEIDALTERLAEAHPETNAARTVRLAPWREVVTGESARPLLLLLGAVGFVLLIACANLSSLLLARGSAREREVSIRAALGASRARMVRQLLTESLLLGLAGGAVGVLVGYLAAGSLEALLPAALREEGGAAVDARVLGFTLLLSLLSGLLFGLAPALQTARGELAGSLRGGAGAGTARERSRAQGLLVVAQVALCLVLLVGAGLMVRSLLELTRVDPGFRSERVVTVGIALPRPQYASDESLTAFWSELLERVRALPQVEAAGAVFPVPLTAANASGSVRAEGRPDPEGEGVRAGFNWVMPGYFETLRIPLRRGRSLDERDREGALEVVVVSETLASRVWPGEDPIGKRITFDDAVTDSTSWLTVVGVVGDVRPRELGNAPQPEVYLPHLQAAWPALTLVVRTRGEDAGPLLAALRREVAAVDPDLPLREARPLAEIIDRTVATPRFRALLLSAFAALALLLAAVGIYGLVSFSVAQRTREIGVRMALGAMPADVVRSFVRGGLRPVLIGLAAGMAAALLAARLLSGLLYGVPETDPVTFVAVPAVLAAVAALAAFLPARRATRVDPIVVLRAD